jgi:IrrE N-terminal-like domain
MSALRPDPRSPWGRGLWIPDSDFELKMDALRARAPMPFEPGRGIDVDRIMMRVYGVNPDFVDLPGACLGRTNFLSDGRYVVEVSRALADEAVHSPVARRRLRTTLAHECAHIALHSVLHPVAVGFLFEELTSRTSVVMCRDTESGAGEWWEVQANRGMGCLLMPRELIKEQTRSWLDANEFATIGDALAEKKGEALLRELSSVFDVNPVVVLYRLQALKLIASEVGQSVMAFEER